MGKKIRTGIKQNQENGRNKEIKDKKYTSMQFIVVGG